VPDFVRTDRNVCGEPVGQAKISAAVRKIVYTKSGNLVYTISSAYRVDQRPDGRWERREVAVAAEE